MNNIHEIIQSAKDFWLAEIDRFWFLHHPIIVKSARYSIGSEVKVLRDTLEGHIEHTWKNTGYDHIDVNMQLGRIGMRYQQEEESFTIAGWKGDKNETLFCYCNHEVILDKKELPHWLIEAILMSCASGLTEIV